MAEAFKIPDEAETRACQGAFAWAASGFGARDIGAPDRASLSEILVEGVE